VSSKTPATRTVCPVERSASPKWFRTVPVPSRNRVKSSTSTVFPRSVMVFPAGSIASGDPSRRISFGLRTSMALACHVRAGGAGDLPFHLDPLPHVEGRTRRRTPPFTTTVPPGPKPRRRTPVPDTTYPSSVRWSPDPPRSTFKTSMRSSVRSVRRIPFPRRRPVGPGRRPPDRPRVP